MRLAQLTRSHEWWDHKTPQVLSLAYATALVESSSLYNLLAPGFLTIFASLIVMAIYASIINDFTDLEIDLACGKSNMMQRLSPTSRLLLVFLSLGCVFTAAFIIYPNIYAVVFYLLIILSISLYSFRPVRLKNRGIWGVISCSSAEHLFPTLFSIAVIAGFSDSKIDILWLCSAGSLSLMYGLRSILWHQFLDRENDIQSAVNTFATTTPPKSFKGGPFLILIELVALAAVLFQMKLILPIVFLLIYLLYIQLRRLLFHSKIIIIISPENEHFQILMLDYYTMFFPISLLICAALKQPLAWIVLVIHVVLFYKMLLITLKEGLYLLKLLFNKIWYRLSNY